LRQLLRGDTAGDPMGRRGLWTSLRLEQISDHLGQLGLSACPNTVRRLLEQLDYALHANRKSLSGPQSPHRDAQFQYIGYQREQFAQGGAARGDGVTPKPRSCSSWPTAVAATVLAAGSGNTPCKKNWSTPINWQ
jgi:hypothetical protein